MEDAYGIGITNRYAFLLDTDANDPQAILKQKAKKAKKAAKKLAGKENTEDKMVEEKKVKFLVPGKRGKQLQSQNDLLQRSHLMKDTQNIQGNESEDIGTNGFIGTRNNFDRNSNFGNNRNYENRDNREQRLNRRNNGTDTNDAGYQTSQDNGYGQPNRGNRLNNGNGDRNNENRNFENRNYEYRNFENRNYENRNFENRNYENRIYENGYNENKNNDFRNNEHYRSNENINNGHEVEYNSQRDRYNDRPARRQFNDRNFGNRDGNRNRSDGQRRNFEGRGGKREFDRQSGSDKTGVKAVEKRSGGGARNWGTHKQDIEDLNKNISEPDLKDEGSSVENARSEENLVVEQKTLDEYRKEQRERARPVYNTRKAGEGEDKKKWKHLVPLQKKKEEKSEDEFEYDPSQYPQRKRGLTFIDPGHFFKASRRFGNSNRGRRNNHFRENNDDRRTYENRQRAPQVDDRNFPSLG